MAFLKPFFFLLLCLALLTPAITAESTEATKTDQSPEDLAAEEAAALAVNQQAEYEDEEDGGDAMDEDADTARPHPDRHPLSLLPAAARDVTIGHAFTSGGVSVESAPVTLGEEVNVLIAFANGARTRMHVWGICGSLNDANRPNVHVQNFTYTHINTTVSANSELSMSYSFTPNERLDTRPFRLALTVFYEAQSADGSALRGHSTTFYDTVINTKAGPQSVSNTAFLLLAALFLAACAAGVAFLLAPTAEPDKKTGAPAAAAAESTSSDWLEEHRNTMQRGGGRAASSKVTKRR